MVCLNSGVVVIVICYVLSEVRIEKEFDADESVKAFPRVCKRSTATCRRKRPSRRNFSMMLFSIVDNPTMLQRNHSNQNSTSINDKKGNA